MKNKKAAALILTALLALSAFSGCAQQKTSVSSASSVSSSGSTSSSSGSASSASGSASSGNTGTATAKNTSTDLSIYDFTCTDTDLSGKWSESGSTSIALDGSGITVKGDGASVSGSVVTIKSAGTYVISGTISDGQVIVEAGEKDKVQIVLKGASLTCSNSAPILIRQADKVFLTLAEGTENTVSDGGAYQLSGDDETVDGAIFSKADLTVNGSGTLTVKANYANGIVSKDDLVLASAALNVTAAKDGIQGKDCVKLNGCTLTVNAGEDGVKSSNSEDAGRGFVSVDGGTLNITAGEDGIQAETVMRSADAKTTIVTGGGSAKASTVSNKMGAPGAAAASSTDDTSAKGIKAGTAVILESGSFSIDSLDDALHSNDTVEIKNGEYTISTGDDGVHADKTLNVSGGTVEISKSYEGLEASAINISGGEIHLTASDDGVNASGGTDSSQSNGRFGGDQFAATSAMISISGGLLVVDASGDGLDSNGSMTISGGTVLVSGPTGSGNGSLDYNGTANITGGTVIAAGSSGMAQTFSDTSTQNSLMYTFTSQQAAGTVFSLVGEDGKAIVSLAPAKAYQTVVVSSPDLKLNGKYTVVTGGTVSGADEDKFASNAAVSGGTQAETVTISSVSVTAGASAGMGGGMKGGMGNGTRPSGGMGRSGRTAPGAADGSGTQTAPPQQNQQAAGQTTTS